MNESKTDNKDLTVYLGLGSNIEPSKNIIAVLSELDTIFELLTISSVYESPPLGAVGPNFLNCAVIIKTDQQLDEIKHILRGIENNMGRIRSEDKNAPRSIDIDILIYHDKILEDEVWTLPHLVLPLSELYPTLMNKRTGKSIKDIANDLYLKFEINRRDDVLRKVNLHLKAHRLRSP